MPLPLDLASILGGAASGRQNLMGQPMVPDDAWVDLQRPARKFATNPNQMQELDRLLGVDEPALGPPPGMMPPPGQGQMPTDPMREAPPNPGQLGAPSDMPGLGGLPGLPAMPGPSVGQGGSPFRNENDAYQFLQQLMGPGGRR